MTAPFPSISYIQRSTTSANAVLRSVYLSASACSLLLVSACTIPKFTDPEYTNAFVGQHVVQNETPQSDRLICLGRYIQEKKLLPTSQIRQGISPSQPVRFAVGRVDDYTGKQDLVNGRRLTQGAGLMAISALTLTRLPQVERSDITLAEVEFRYTDNKLLGDSQNNNYRQIFAGSVPGSDFHFMGGITEANYNIRSGEIEGTAKYVGASARYAVIDVGLDMRLVNTRTLEIVSANTFRKQLIGTEYRTGYFRFFNDTFFDFSTSERAQEPVQRAVRMVVEHSIYKLLLDLYRVPATVCDPVTAEENSKLKLTETLK